MSLRPFCIFRIGSGPIVAAAIHHGHDSSPDVAAHFALTEAQRRYEEDPHTGEWTQIANTQIVGLRTRFELDLNRPREKAIYRTPEEAWGLDVWKSPLPADILRERYRQYDDFYATVFRLLNELLQQHPRLVVYDLHTYNHRPAPKGESLHDDARNPEVNLGTGTMNREDWSTIVDRFLRDCAFDFKGRTLDVRENVKFKGGYFGKWIHQTFPRRVCSLAVEFKKFFMDEAAQTADPADVEWIFKALQSTVPGLREELERQ